MNNSNFSPPPDEKTLWSSHFESESNEVIDIDDFDEQIIFSAGELDKNNEIEMGVGNFEMEDEEMILKSEFEQYVRNDVMDSDVSLGDIYNFEDSTPSSSPTNHVFQSFGVLNLGSESISPEAPPTPCDSVKNEMMDGVVASGPLTFQDFRNADRTPTRSSPRRSTRRTSLRSSVSSEGSGIRILRYRKTKKEKNAMTPAETIDEKRLTDIRNSAKYRESQKEKMKNLENKVATLQKELYQAETQNSKLENEYFGTKLAGNKLKIGLFEDIKNQRQVGREERENVVNDHKKVLQKIAERRAEIQEVEADDYGSKKKKTSALSTNSSQKSRETGYLKSSLIDLEAYNLSTTLMQQKAYRTELEKMIPSGMDYSEEENPVERSAHHHDTTGTETYISATTIILDPMGSGAQSPFKSVNAPASRRVVQMSNSISNNNGTYGAGGPYPSGSSEVIPFHTRKNAYRLDGAHRVAVVPNTGFGVGANEAQVDSDNDGSPFYTQRSATHLSESRRDAMASYTNVSCDASVTNLTGSSEGIPFHTNMNASHLDRTHRVAMGGAQGQFKSVTIFGVGASGTNRAGDDEVIPFHTQWNATHLNGTQRDDNRGVTAVFGVNEAKLTGGRHDINHRVLTGFTTKSGTNGTQLIEARRDGNRYVAAGPGNSHIDNGARRDVMASDTNNSFVVSGANVDGGNGAPLIDAHCIDTIHNAQVLTSATTTPPDSYVFRANGGPADGPCANRRTEFYHDYTACGGAGVQGYREDRFAGAAAGNHGNRSVARNLNASHHVMSGTEASRRRGVGTRGGSAENSVDASHQHHDNIQNNATGANPTGVIANTILYRDDNNRGGVGVQGFGAARCNPFASSASLRGGAGNHAGRPGPIKVHGGVGDSRCDKIAAVAGPNATGSVANGIFRTFHATDYSAMSGTEPSRGIPLAVSTGGSVGDIIHMDNNRGAMDAIIRSGGNATHHADSNVRTAGADTIRRNAICHHEAAGSGPGLLNLHEADAGTPAEAQARAPIFYPADPADPAVF